MAGTARRAVVCALLFASLAMPIADAVAEITSVDELRELTEEQAADKLTVKLTGTILFVNQNTEFFCLNSGRKSVVVRFTDELAADAGDRVEVVGRTRKTPFATEVVADQVTHIGDGDPPPDPFPLVRDGGQIDHLHGQWAEFEGIVYHAHARSQHDCLHLAGADFGLRALVPEPTSLRPLDQLGGRRVILRGVCMLRERESETRIELHVPQSGVVRIGSEVGDDEIPMVSISEWKSFDLKTRPNGIVQARVQVTQRTPGRWVFVFDKTGRATVQLQTPTELQPGDVIQVRGVLQQTKGYGQIIRASVEKLGRGTPPETVKVKPGEGRDHIGEIVDVKGILAAHKRREGGGLHLLMHSGTMAFSAVVRASVATEISESELQAGNELRLVGVCRKGPEGEAAFQIVAESVSVLSAAPMNKTVSAWPIGLTVASIVALTLTVVLIWLHRRQAAGQKLFYTQVHEQLDGMAHIARVNTLAEMVGALSHELSQPLASLSNFASAAQSLGGRVEDAPPQLIPIIGRIKDEAHRANELIRRLRQLTRRQTSGREPADVDALVLEAVELFRFQGSAQTLVVDLELHGDLPAVDLDLIQMEQVLLNLLNNARDATLGLQDRRPSITVRTTLVNDEVAIAVEDNGIGMLEPDGGAAFEPYYTTKPEGTGLGLAISRTIVEAHGGTIVAEANEPLGTRFRLLLPALATTSTGAPARLASSTAASV